MAVQLALLAKAPRATLSPLPDPPGENTRRVRCADSVTPYKPGTRISICTEVGCSDSITITYNLCTDGPPRIRAYRPPLLRYHSFILSVYTVFVLFPPVRRSYQPFILSNRLASYNNSRALPLYMYMQPAPATAQTRIGFLLLGMLRLKPSRSGSSRLLEAPRQKTWCPHTQIQVINKTATTSATVAESLKPVDPS